ncbi:hypothetical protein ILUMI_20432 [Ignelater luminosus]|uniref:Uncharacterized protein n=1 Tax=Ignelater luminosus TaxID=2038154 RepID=A0A8K0CE98_IGNLU|nr:hypothetical protein ILUMI_20432 [Ignelater luminosus]
MKRPVTTAVTYIHKLCLKFLNSSDNHHEHLITKFLEYILCSIYMAPDHLKSKIRRNPEHRLIIHAIVTADQRHAHPFLFRTLNFLNGILSDDSSASSFIVSSLHTIEILISDNSLRFTMQPFVVPTAVHCIDRFSNKNWPIKNAAIQVLQSLVNRILGQKTNKIHRRNPINEVFTLFPQLASYFYSKLQVSDTENIQDSIIAILAIFSESHSTLDATLNKDIKLIIESFVRIFNDLICTNVNIIGKFAAKAFVALYPTAYIPFLICDIVEWIEVNFCHKSKNIFYTFMCALESLYEKFNIYNYVPYYSVGLRMIKLSFQRLMLFLKRFNVLYEYSLFNLLNIKLSSIDCIEKSIEYQLQSNSYQARLWCNNHVPYTLDHINIEKFPHVLKICLDNTTSIHLQNHCLNCILNRHQELSKQSLINNVLDLIIDKFLNLTNNCDYLIISYSHVILLLFENTSYCFTDDLLNKIRTLYNFVNVNNIYVVSTFISFLSYFDCYNNADQIFIKNAIVTYKNATMTDDFEMHYHVSSTLKYLYSCVQISDRCNIFKMTFVLLMDQECEISSEVCRFIATVLNIELCNIHTTLYTLLSYKHLLQQLGTIENVCAFLVDVSVLTSSLDDIFVDCGQFYMKQTSDICLHKHCLRDIILKELKNMFKYIPTCITFSSFYYEDYINMRTLVLFFVTFTTAHALLLSAKTREKLVTQFFGLFNYMFQLEEDKPIHEDVTFHLYTRSNPERGIELFLDDVNSLYASRYNSQFRTIFIIHGYTDHKDRDIIIALRRVLLHRFPVNVIVVDWKRLAGFVYFNAATYSLSVGNYLARFLRFLERNGVKLSNVHLIGHSLGAQISGVAGAALNGKVGRITGLDPAGPLFEFIYTRNLSESLDKRDAMFVDVIHTAGNDFGIMLPVGHVDFYPNDGITPQPGCTNLFTTISCSHIRSIEFFIESVNGTIPFLSKRCAKFEGKAVRSCNTRYFMPMGYYTPDDARGLFYLKTNSKAPFAIGG